MHPGSWIDTLLRFATDHPFLAGLLAVLLLFLAWRQPRELLKLLALAAALAAVFYLLGLFGDTLDTGTRQKEQTVHKTERALQE